MCLGRILGLLQLSAALASNENAGLLQRTNTRVIASKEDCSEGGCKPISTKHVEAGNLRSGIACHDRAHGYGFIMFSQQNVHQRWSDPAVLSGHADHFVCVRENENGAGWEYGTNSEWALLEPQDQDTLMAFVDFDKDVVTPLLAETFTAGIYNSIAMGYFKGDVTFTANIWKNQTNAGEFDVAGSGFDVVTGVLPTLTTTEVNQALYGHDVAAGNLRSGIACNDRAQGYGFIMFSLQNVHQRWPDPAVLTGQADHFVCVRENGAGWEYDTNSEWALFEPQDQDTLMALIDFDKDVVTPLVAETFTAGIYSSIAMGYLKGDVTFTANMWKNQTNAGEFDVAGSGFDIVTGVLPTLTTTEVNNAFEAQR